MGLHSTNLEMSVAARWSARAFVVLALAGYLVSYFSPASRPYLILFLHAVGVWARGGAWWVGPPAIAHRALLVALAPPVGAAVILSAGWAAYWSRSRRRRRPAPAAARRGAGIEDRTGDRYDA